MFAPVSKVRKSDANRMAAKLPANTEKSLLTYAAAATAAGVGLLALAQPSEAKVVFTAVQLQLPVNQPTYIDLNNDGVNDFKLFPVSSDLNLHDTQGVRSSEVIKLYGVGSGNQIWGKAPYASALTAGVKVGPGGPFSKSNNLMGFESKFSSGPTNYAGPWAPDGQVVRNHFLGFKFLINGQVHYGWARMTVQIRRPEIAGLKAVLTGYAYETVPNRPLVTGKTSSAAVVASANPAGANVSTLGALAQGARGLSIWRREEDALDG